VLLVLLVLRVLLVLVLLQAERTDPMLAVYQVRV
jgi:preprotein translocase subunit SecG